jgi:hypothetical protein
MFGSQKKFMKHREDGRCPFCGTEVRDFSICKGCNAEKMYSNNDTSQMPGLRSLLTMATIILQILILLFFQKFILTIVDMKFSTIGVIIYYFYVTIITLSFLVLIIAWFKYLINRTPFKGDGWKRGS